MKEILSWETNKKITIFQEDFTALNELIHLFIQYSV